MKTINNLSEKLNSAVKKGEIPAKIAQTLQKFYLSYASALSKNNHDAAHYDPLIFQFVDLVIDLAKNPPVFEPYHEHIRAPFDYYQFGLDFIRPLVHFETSKVLGLANLEKMALQVQQGQNVILFANHQTEPDPQAISLLLEKTHPKFAEEMIFVAGHRVISDPLAIPFSLGRNLLCIFSKKYIEHPPEKKEEKLQHNQRTMKQMSRLLSEGGKCIYVAPSGGRDRPNPEGIVEVAKFDTQSIEMFWLMSRQSDKETHFYPLALSTYDLLPPPSSIKKEIGENRMAQATPIHLAFGNEIDMENFSGSATLDKRQKRKMRADYIWEQVRNDYNLLIF